MPDSLTILPTGAVRPEGWLLRQLEAQAAGLSGHIDEFWPDLGPDNMWLGGTLEGWERGPYYLDGLVPLAHALDSARLKQKANRWIDAILSSAQPDGWIGPVKPPGRRPYDAWPIFVVFKALAQHHEAAGDERVMPVMLRFCKWLETNLAEKPLFEWGQYRWHDLALSIHWLYNRVPEAWLLEVARAVQRQGFDWRAHFEEFRYTEKVKPEELCLATHVVNNAMAMKAGGISYRLTGDEADRNSIYRALEMLHRYHGQANGTFSGDEHFAGLSPTQGTELCAVVEAMYSLEILLGITGDPLLADRLERIAYNALPATCTADFWAHQYDQQVNQVLCTVAPRAWTNNGDDSNIYGLEPNFGCCTANMHQGWPKLLTALWMASPDGGVAALAYAPCRVCVRVAGGAEVVLREVTEYPFLDTVRIEVVSVSEEAEFTLRVRCPEWAEAAEARVGGETPLPLMPGHLTPIRRRWRAGDAVEMRLPMRARVERRHGASISVCRGPLHFGLRIGERFEQIGGTLPHADYAVYPTTPWNYAISPDAGAYRVTAQPPATLPWSSERPPVTLRVQAMRLDCWKLEQNSAGAVPDAAAVAAASAPLEEVELVPYGCTRLRIAEFPELQST